MRVAGDAAGRSAEGTLRSAPARTLLAAVVGLAVTSVILFTPYLTFGFSSPQAHLVLNTLDAAIGLLAAFLVYGRFAREGLLQDLLLVQGLALLVVAGLGLNNFTDMLPDVRPGTLDVWLPLAVRLTGSLLIAAAAVVGPLRRVRRRRWMWWGLVLAVAVSIAPVAAWSGLSELPVALDLSVPPDSAQHPILTGHPLLLAAQAVAALCFAVAAVLFGLRSDDVQDRLLLWLGPACALGAFARLNYVLFPSLYTDWLYTGDLLRTGFYVLLLVGASLEIRRYWSDQAEFAVLEDRRRLARELHDGVIQELSFIKARSVGVGVDGGVDERWRDQILRACERGLEEARAAVVALGAQSDEPLSSVLARATRQLAEQYAVDVVLDLDDAVAVDAEERHALVRIAREAVTNAIKHGGAQRLHVVLEHGPHGRCLAVRDDGAGFDPERVLAGDGTARTGYGLVSMRDRAHALPGRLDIRSEPGAGAEVKVTW